MENRKVLSFKNQSDFRRLFQSGYRFSPDPMLTVFFSKNESLGVRLGLTLPKKVGNAVTRNKLKRWCREYVRLRQFEIENTDIHIFFRPQKKPFYQEMKHRDLDGKLQKAWNKIRKST